MAPQVGLEPTTLRLTAGCSAIELLRSVVLRSYKYIIRFRASVEAPKYPDFSRKKQAGIASLLEFSLFGRALVAGPYLHALDHDVVDRHAAGVSWAHVGTNPATVLSELKTELGSCAFHSHQPHLHMLEAQRVARSHGHVAIREVVGVTIPGHMLRVVIDVASCEKLLKGFCQLGTSEAARR